MAQSHSNRRILLVPAGVCALMMPVCLLGAADDLAHFEREVRPIFEAHCHKCHGPGEKVKAGLRLTSRHALLSGGDRGPAVDLANPDASLLLDMLSYRDEHHQMPPSGKLPEEAIAAITAWVRAGAPMPDTGEPHPETPVLEDPRLAAGKSHWAYQPLTAPPVPAANTPAENPIDAFLLAKLQEKGLSPAPRAARGTLVRRAYYDLIGLPPTPSQAAAFVSDPREDTAAFAALVDDLLDSPHYGEKWGRHWLDLVRYAETNGYERDTPKPHIWRYRDYVVNAFNEDKPYDVFVREQLAGDELGEAGPDQIIATGYYRLGIWDDEPADKAQGKYDVLDGIIDTTGQVFLGTTMGCARCHDHKIDPISQAEYHGMLAIFHNITDMDKTRIVRNIMSPGEQEEHDRRIAEKRERERALELELRDLEVTFATRLREKDASLSGPLHASDLTGLRYRFYRDTFVALLNFDRLRHETEGRIDHNFIDLAPRSRDDSFAFVFDATLHVPESGDFTFHIVADDGARLAIDGKVLLTLDGVNKKRGERKARTQLDAGAHAIRLEYFQNKQDFRLDVRWSGPGFTRRALSRDPQMPDLPKLMKERGPELLSAEERDRYAAAKQELETARAEAVPGGKFAACVEEKGAEAPETHVFIRGNPHVPGAPAPPAFPAILNPPPFAPVPLPDGTPSTGRRRALAEWIADADNPLTARVMANRIWQHHFGRGIVRSSNNFGLGGTPPTHPELLDWLASEFVRQGWRMKPMHRLIMNSNAYAMSTAFDDRAYAADPENDAFWRFDLRRLSAEELRDAILSVTGVLNPKLGGESVFPPMPKETLATSSTPGAVWGVSPEEEHTRRSLYVHVKRSLLTPLLQDYDMADTDNSCPVRFVTTQPAQALNLLNSEFAQDQARVLARRVQREAGDDPADRVRLALHLVASRAPDDREIRMGLRFVEEMRREESMDLDTALERFCLLALNLNEFLFID